MRYALAILVLALTTPIAVYIHERRVPYGPQLPTFTSDQNSTPEATLPNISLGPIKHRPSWEDPVAALLVVGGVAIAVAIVASRTERG